MKSLIITPSGKKEFEIVLTLLSDFGKERKLLSLEDDEEISFAFLMNVEDSPKEVTGRVVTGKTVR